MEIVSEIAVLTLMNLLMTVVNVVVIVIALRRRPRKITSSDEIPF